METDQFQYCACPRAVALASNCGGMETVIQPKNSIKSPVALASNCGGMETQQGFLFWVSGFWLGRGGNVGNRSILEGVGGFGVIVLGWTEVEIQRVALASKCGGMETQ